MADVRADRRGGHLVYWDGHRMRVVGVEGPDVVAWELSQHQLQDQGATGTDPAGYITTVVEAGAGTSEFAQSVTPGIVGRITCAANENDGLQTQHFGTQFEVTSNQTLVYFGCEVAINDVDQTDILVGLCSKDTTLLGGVSDGVYIESLDGGATISTITEIANAETQNDSEGTLVDAQYHVLEFYYDGTSVYFFFDGSQTGNIHTAGIPTAALGPSLAFLTGEAVANTIDFRWARAFMVGRT